MTNTSPSKYKIIISIILIIFLIIGLVNLIRSEPQNPPKLILSFEECAQAGYPVMESYPRQCKTPDGKTFAEELPAKITYTKASKDLIVVELPFPGAVVGKEFSVLGKARGYWFGASFPIDVLDMNGKLLTQGIAQAEGEWMTEDFVFFKANIKIPETYIGKATLVLRKDNASGLPEHDASISFPITIEY